MMSMRIPKNECKHSFIHTDDDTQIIVTFSGHTSMDNIIDRFKSYLLAIGFHPDTVNAYLEPEESD